jgi:propanol-preferring alcohol dehydrogenase
MQKTRITRGVTGKQKMQGFSCDGYFQEYVCVDAGTTMVLPEELDVTLAAPPFCAGITALKTAG